MAHSLIVLGVLIVSDLSVESLVSLPSRELSEVVRGFLKDRQSALSNIRVETESNVTNMRFIDNQVEGSPTLLARSTETYWRRGTAQRLKSDRFQPINNAPLISVNSNYRADEGIGVMWSSHRDLGRPHARISREQDEAFDSYQYGRIVFHEDDRRIPQFPFVGDCLNCLRLRCDNLIARVKSPTEIEIGADHYPAHVLASRWSFDISKDWLLTAWARTDASDVTPEKPYIKRLEILESRQFGSTWMPTSFRYIAATSVSPPGLATVYSVSVKELEFGGVSEDDLQVSMPDGTEVSDMIENRVYYVGGKEPERVFPKKDGPANRQNNWRLAFFWSQFAAILLIIVGVCLRRRGH